jgi:pyruvate/2-oxoglutarate dehydrogenase complex dihydrolipoamide dehydrogenase (E3) component
VGAEIESVSARDGRTLAWLSGGGQLEGRELIVAGGRRPRIDGLGLDRVGIDPGESGIEVDHRCRAADGIWAVGDVTGVAPFTHVAKYQGQIVIDDICGRSPRADYTAIPRVVFCDPEVAAVGMTEAQARDVGLDVATSHVKLAETIARPHTYETEPRGELAVVADARERILVGAWAVSTTIVAPPWCCRRWLVRARRICRRRFADLLLLYSCSDYTARPRWSTRRTRWRAVRRRSPFPSATLSWGLR